jgi:acetyl-CoA carboxylase carboxyl transferase subunit alpha
MLSYSTYSVISPEGCASILYKNANKAQEAAESMGITSDRLLGLKLIDEIIPEPLCGAHRDLQITCENMRRSLAANLSRLLKLDTQELLKQRYDRLTSYGVFKD